MVKELKGVKLAQRIEMFKKHYQRQGFGVGYQYNKMVGYKLSLTANSRKKPEQFEQLGAKFFRAALAEFNIKLSTWGRVWNDCWSPRKDGSKYKRISGAIVTHTV